MSKQLADRLTEKLENISSSLSWWAEPEAGIYWVRVINIHLKEGENALLRAEGDTLSGAIKKALKNLDLYSVKELKKFAKS